MNIFINKSPNGYLYVEHVDQSIQTHVVFGVCSWSHTKPHTTQI